MAVSHLNIICANHLVKNMYTNEVNIFGINNQNTVVHNKLNGD